MPSLVEYYHKYKIFEFIIENYDLCKNEKKLDKKEINELVSAIYKDIVNNNKVFAEYEDINNVCKKLGYKLIDKNKIISSYNYMQNLLKNYEIKRFTESVLIKKWFTNGVSNDFNPEGKDYDLVNREDYYNIKNEFEELCLIYNIPNERNKWDIESENFIYFNNKDSQEIKKIGIKLISKYIDFCKDDPMKMYEYCKNIKKNNNGISFEEIAKNTYENDNYNERIAKIKLLKMLTNFVYKEGSINTMPNAFHEFMYEYINLFIKDYGKKYEEESKYKQDDFIKIFNIKYISNQKDISR